MTRPDALYVKLKMDSPFTVSRARIDSMADFFQQDATFVTHFALARLSDEIAQGKLSRATDIPIASAFLSPEQVGQLRQHAQQKLGNSEVKWDANPALESLLG
jgi:hypothetical protein